MLTPIAAFAASSLSNYSETAVVKEAIATSVKSGVFKDSTGADAQNAAATGYDICANIDGIQSSIPSGYTLIAKDVCRKECQDYMGSTKVPMSCGPEYVGYKNIDVVYKNKCTWLYGTRSIYESVSQTESENYCYKPYIPSSSFLTNGFTAQGGPTGYAFATVEYTNGVKNTHLESDPLKPLYLTIEGYSTCNVQYPFTEMVLGSKDAIPGNSGAIDYTKVSYVASIGDTKCNRVNFASPLYLFLQGTAGSELGEKLYFRSTSTPINNSRPEPLNGFLFTLYIKDGGSINVCAGKNSPTGFNHYSGCYKVPGYKTRPHYSYRQASLPAIADIPVAPTPNFMPLEPEDEYTWPIEP